MDFIFLPEDVKEAVEAVSGGKEPVSVLRTNGNMLGDPGEGYIVAFEDRVFLFSRGMGEDGYQQFDAAYNEVNNMHLRQEKFNSFLDINIAGKALALKFSSYEEKELGPIVSLWNSAGGGGAVTPGSETVAESSGGQPPPLPGAESSPQPPPLPGTQGDVQPPPLPNIPSGVQPPPLPGADGGVQPPPLPDTAPSQVVITATDNDPATPQPPPLPGAVVTPGSETRVEPATSQPPPLPQTDDSLSPMACAVAAFMFMAGIDQDIDESEEKYIKKICQNKEELQVGVNYYNDNNFEELLKLINVELDQQQKLCILANLLELGMSDAVLHRSEQRVVRDYLDGVGLTEDDYQKVRDVLLLKNQISVLQ